MREIRDSHLFPAHIVGARASRGPEIGDCPGFPTVVSIQIAEEDGATLRSVQEAELVAGKGIVGDRYFHKDDKEPGQEVTLVEAEQIERFNAETGLSIDPSDTRRNITVRGVPLNDLVGVEFAVGEAVVRGVELCPPCGYVAKTIITKFSITDITAPQIVAGLKDRAGLLVRIVTGGTVRVGDAVRSEPAP